MPEETEITQEEQEEPEVEASPPPPKASFPWLMLGVAIIFDIIEYFIRCCCPPLA